VVKFVALPVGQGDAFYLEREGFSVLVDGGKSRSAISGFVSNIAKINQLDVIVCTHNDADHANGVIGLLENWSGTVNEVWLPGSWTYRLAELLTKPAEFCRELVENVRGLDGETSTLESIKCSSIDLADGEKPNPDEVTLDVIFGDASEYLDHPFERLLDWRVFELFFYHCLFRLHHLSPNTCNLFFDAIKTADRIRKIALLAYHRGCKIRFFEFGPENYGGLTGKLEPVNSKEIVQIRKKTINALTYLALSTSNKESLVFFAPESKAAPSVLFAADSDLNFGLPAAAPNRSVIVTAPHHGSDQNRDAYHQVSSWLLSNKVQPIWIRSDCKSKSRPGSSFKGETAKTCTLCNCGVHPKQTVKCHTRLGKWQFTRGTRRCSCK